MSDVKCDILSNVIIDVISNVIIDVISDVKCDILSDASMMFYLRFKGTFQVWSSMTLNDVPKILKF